MNLAGTVAKQVGEWSRMRPLRSWAFAFCLLLVCGGCEDPGGIHAQGPERGVLQRRIGQLEREQITLREENKTLRKQIKQLQRLGAKRLDLLNAPVKIQIERLSGGYNDDGVPGDDGVVVYIRPIDGDGDVLKATGDIQIQLWDLAGTTDELLVGEYILDAEHALGRWYGKLMTHHYTVKCPWRSEPPAHNEITIRVLFTDYLTGRVLSDQRVCRIVLPTAQAQGQ